MDNSMLSQSQDWHQVLPRALPLEHLHTALIMTLLPDVESCSFAMKKIKELFDAKASSPSETAMLHNGAVGFRIPEYQREFSWSDGNIARLFMDCLSGFERLSTSPNADAFTFLGTLILVEEKTREEDFTGTSVDVIDGQQRLTTLTLLACGLYERLNVAFIEIEDLQLNEKVKAWIKSEIEGRQGELLDCAAGTQKIKGNQTYPFPRIVREGDTRGRSHRTSEYLSPLGQFLNAFAKYANEDAEVEFVPPSLGSGVDAQKLGESYNQVRELLANLNDPQWYEKEAECGQMMLQWLNRSGYRTLLDRLAVTHIEADQNKAISDLQNCVAAHDMVRTLLFAAYFCQCIVLTRVTTDDQRAAFDIFDALNTTGEPLTALETLKPRVIEYENSHGGFRGTQSDTAFQRLKAQIEQRYKDTTRRQKETKELVVSFALYIEGKKLSETLGTQRNFLRGQYDISKTVSQENAQRFVSLLADMAEFRWFYWTNEGLGELGRFHTEKSLGEVQLLMSFIKDTQTKLALPILARYWNTHLKQEGERQKEFLDALKALTAFLVLRRAASGGTAGIDSDLRAIMAPRNGSNKKFGLCAGTDSENQRLSIPELKTAFKKLLSESQFRIAQEDKWVGQVIDNPLYQQSRSLVRFMLLTAAHQSIPSSNQPGCWDSEGLRASSHTNNFLNYETWTSELYETVEHIAPEAEPKSGWDSEIYKNMTLRHSLGNLILLPKKENGAIGNGSWSRKKVFYSALTAQTDEQLQQRIDEAAALGMEFSKYTKDLLKKGERLTLIAALRDVEAWNKDVIEARARNTASLTWKRVRPWLD